MIKTFSIHISFPGFFGGIKQNSCSKHIGTYKSKWIGYGTIDMRFGSQVYNTINYIVCEQTRNYSFLNSSTNCEQNIFNNFRIKDNCKIIQIPNLELRYYSNDLIYKNNEDINNVEIVNSIKKENLKKIIEHCRKYEFNNLSTYIEQNINNVRLFTTFNHPCNNVILEIFKEIIEKMFDQQLPEPILNILRKVRIFDNDGTRTKIKEIDYQTGLSTTIK